MKLIRNYTYLANRLFSLFFGLFKTRKDLENSIIESLKQYNKNSFYKFHINGRSAICSLLIYLRMEKGVTHILLPYRLCNVVTDAAIKAGFNIDYYSDKNDFYRLIEKEKKPIVILQASTHVSELFTRTWYNCEHYFIYDECQRLSISSLNFFWTLSQKEFLTYSFNDKNIPGQMGAICIGNDPNYTPRLSSLGKREFLFFAYDFKDIIMYLVTLPKIAKNKGDFSFNTGLRYLVCDFKISKVSLIYAEFWISKLSEIEKIRKNRWKYLSSKFNINPNIDLPYVKAHKNDLNRYIEFKYFKAPYLNYDVETLENALNDQGAYAIINSIKYFYK